MAALDGKTQVSSWQRQKIKNADTALRVGSNHSATMLDGMRGALEMLSIADRNQKRAVKQTIVVCRECEDGMRVPGSSIQNVDSEKVEKTEAVEVGADGTIAKQLIMQQV